MLRVLTYHRVTPLEDSHHFDPRMISATPEAFAEQMRWLAHRYEVVSIQRVLDHFRHGASLPGRAVLVTFDDAYYDFEEHAWPVLRDLDVPCVLFVPTGFPDDPTKPFWWDRLHEAVHRSTRKTLEVPGVGTMSLTDPDRRDAALRALQTRLKELPHAEAMDLVDRIWAEHGSERHDEIRRTLSWDRLRKLARDGVTIGAHTRNHPMMTRIGATEVRAEVTGSQADLEREIGETLPIFCYPAGGHDDTVVQTLREEGFQLAFTTLDGHNDLGTCDLLRLCRTNVTRRTTLPILRLRLQRWFAWVDRLRHR